jgi:hypothetical protein
MTQEEVLQEVLQRLEDFGIHYMVAGSYASNQYSVPRATFDADVIIECDEHALRMLMRSFADDYYADELAAIDALRHRSLSSVVHKQSGFKVDLIFLKDRRYSTHEFKRRTRRAFHGAVRWLSTPEDVILAKLEWSRVGNSERQLTDALGVMKLQRERLDVSYMKAWAKELDVEEMLDDLLKLAGMEK